MGGVGRDVSLSAGGVCRGFAGEELSGFSDTGLAGEVFEGGREGRAEDFGEGGAWGWQECGLFVGFDLAHVYAVSAEVGADGTDG